ncbi:MAG: hypothetical protein ACE5JF_10500, partial [Anaerolineales bacterium]
MRTNGSTPFISTRFGLEALLLAMILLGSACNRPAEEPPPNVLATSVSSTLTAQPTLKPSATPPAPTQEAGGEIDESTPEPGETAEGTEAAPTEELTEEPEASPTPSRTPIPLEPGDPREGLNLSDPDYVD